MPVVAPIVAVVGAVASVASAGYAIYSSQQQAKTQSALAQQNFDLQQDALADQRRQRLRALELQSSQISLQESQKQIEQSAIDTQKAALSLTKQLQTDTLKTRLEQIDKQREVLKSNKANAEQAAARIAMEASERNRRRSQEKEKMISRQRAVFAAAGIVMGEGTPLAVLGETAALYAMQSADEVYMARLEHRGEINRAKSIGLDIEGLDLQAQLYKLDNRLQDTQTGVDQAMLDIEAAGSRIQTRQLGLQKTLLELDSYSVASQFRQQSRQNEIDRLAGFAQSESTQMSSYGQLFSGISSTAGSIYSTSQDLFKTPSTATLVA